jgi:hypothetical protein
MTNRKTLVILWLMSQVLLSSRVLSAQSGPASAVPVKIIETKEEVLNGSRSFIITLKNEAQKPIVAFMAVCELLDSEGVQFDKTLMGGVTLDANEERYDPEKTWKIQVAAASEKSPGTRVSAVRMNLDYVLFRDLSGVGPDVEKQGKLIRSEYLGSQMQLARLRRLLNNKGIAAVQAVLSQEEPRFQRFSQD